MKIKLMDKKSNKYIRTRIQILIGVGIEVGAIFAIVGITIRNGK